MRRRELLGALAAAGVAASWPAPAQEPIARKGRLKQALWPVNFGRMGPEAAYDLEEMCEVAVRVGAVGFDILPPDSWPTQRRYGLVPTLAGPGGIDFDAGIIHPEIHDAQLEKMAAHAKVCADADVRRMAINAGQRRGLSLEEAADNAVAFLERVKVPLEENGVVLCIENVNDRRPPDSGLGRQDMAFGHWDWGIDVVRRVGSPNVKLLCDIYHLQIMDGDVAWRIRETAEWIAHFHVAGVPTRNEIDGAQELNYRYIAEVIAGLDYDGYVSHEWRPSPGRDPVESIAQAIEIMDV